MYYQIYLHLQKNSYLAGVVRFELTNDRVRADCLTTWRHPNIYKIFNWFDNFKAIPNL